MRVFKSWAAAFVNTLEKERADFEDGFNTFLAIGSWAAKLPGGVSGRADAEKLEPLIREALAADANAAAAPEKTNARETALRFFLLMVKKNKMRHFDFAAQEIKNLIDRKRGVAVVSAEYAFEPDEALTLLIYDAVKKRTGAEKIELTKRLNPELLGGYRLRIGDEVIDASLRAQMRSMETCLAAGTSPGGAGTGGTTAERA